MRKILNLILILSLCLILTSCGEVKVSKEITYEEIYVANEFDTILNKYENVSYTLTDLLDDNNSYTLYCDKDSFVLDKKNYVRVTYKNNDYYYDKLTDEFYKVYNVTGSSYKDNHGKWCIIYNQKGDETISYFKENENTYSMLVTLTGETAEKEISYLTNKKLISNENVVYDIVVSKDDMLVKEFTEYIINTSTNKKTKCAKVSNIKYNESELKYIEMARDLEEKYESLKENQFRKITIIKNPNSDNEEKIVFNVKKGEVNHLLIASSDIGDTCLNYEAYQNRDCTIPYAYDINSLYDDITIYLKEIK